MNAEKTINRVLATLGMKTAEAPIEAPEQETTKVELGQMKSEDGATVFESESFAVGDALFVVTEEGQIQAPAGTFVLENGQTVMTDDMGVISAVQEAGEEAAEVEAEEAPMEEEMQEAKTAKKVVKSKTEMEESYFSAQFAALEKRIAELEANRIELQKENEDLQKALSEEPANHSKFNPEMEPERKVKFHIGNRRQATVKDRVFQNLFN